VGPIYIKKRFLICEDESDTAVLSCVQG